MAERNATATWEGDLFSGKGTVTAASSGLFTDAPVTWAARTEESGGMTSPEELIAAAHAACFCMALSNELAQRGNPAASISAEARCSFEGGKVTTMELRVTADVPGADQQSFQEAFAAAEGSCPISNALRGNVDITAHPTLAGG